MGPCPRPGRPRSDADDPGRFRTKDELVDPLSVLTSGAHHRRRPPGGFAARGEVRRAGRRAAQAWCEQLTTPLTPIRRPRPRRRRRRRSLIVFVAAVVATAVVAVLVVWAHGRRQQVEPRPWRPPRRQGGQGRVGRRQSRGVFGLVEHRTGTLASPVQDAAAASVRGGVMLLGGLTAADTSRTDVRIATATGDRAAGELPTALHDTAAVRLGNSVYLFGGGTGSNTQSDEILRIPEGGGSAVLVARLPAPSSDQSAAAIGGTAYVVGGYTGSAWLDTIVAWRPGSAPRVVAHLPYAVRYAAVAAAGGRLVIAGGSLENGSASAAVLAYRPGSTTAVRIGRLPAPTTHAAAATLGGIAYVIGGRGAVLDTPVSRIVAVDPRTRRIRTAGTLVSPRSDLAAATLGNGILVAGGPRYERHGGGPRRAQPTGSRLATRSSTARGARDPAGKRVRLRRRQPPDRGRSLRQAARLRSEQPERHRRRDRPAHVPDRRALRRWARSPSTSCRPGTSAISTSRTTSVTA